MIRLSDAVRTPAVPKNRVIDLLGGVKLTVRPRTSGLEAAATSEATRRVAAIQREADDQASAGQPLDATGFNGANEAAINGLFWQYQTEALLRLATVSWEGVGDAEGSPLPLSADACAAFAAVPSLAGAFRAAYDESTLMQVAEGNGSAPTSDGATGRVGSTAQDATSEGGSTANPAVPSADPAPPS